MLKLGDKRAVTNFSGEGDGSQVYLVNLRLFNFSVEACGENGVHLTRVSIIQWEENSVKSCTENETILYSLAMIDGVYPYILIVYVKFIKICLRSLFTMGT